MSIETQLRELTQFWHMSVPAAMARLHLSTRITTLGPCSFYAVEMLLDEPARWRGMLPQFLPFGEDGDENLFGIYALPGQNRRDFPILWWNHEYDHYLPIASGFDQFLQACVVTGRYDAQDADSDETPTEQEIGGAVKQLSLSAELMRGDPPRNERELAERLVKEDGQNALALAKLGGSEIARGELQRARDFLARSSEAAPWFSDPYFLLGETYRIAKDEPRARDLWWRVFESPVSFCSRSGVYGLCSEGDDAEIYELAAKRSCEGSPPLTPDLENSPIWQLLISGDPFVSGSRLELGRIFSRQGDPAAAEREYLNALTLATEDEEIDEAYDALTLFYESAGRDRDAALCRFDAHLGPDE